MLISHIVQWLDSGRRQESLTIDGQNILDLDIETESSAPKPASVPSSNAAADPAILSYARPSSDGQISAVSQYIIQPDQPNHAHGALHTPVSPIQSLHKFPLKPRDDSTSLVMRQDGPAPSAILTEPFNALSINGNADIRNQSSNTNGHSMRGAGKGDQRDEKLQSNDVSLKTKAKRGRRKNATGKDPKQITRIQAMPISQEVLDVAPQLTPKLAMGPGWRETPLTETGGNKIPDPPQLPEILKGQAPNDQLQIPTSTNSKASRRMRRRRPTEHDDEGGWATGEATDIQGMGDFDFEENHKKFDKKKVFEQIRQDDTTADEARLVSFNRLPARPGTYGGKNLHYTENVLDSPTRDLAQNSSDSDLGITEAKTGRGRIARRTSSKMSQQKVPSRKGSAYVDPEGLLIGIPIVTDTRAENFQRGSFEAPLSSNPSLRSHKSSSRPQKPALQTAASEHRCPYVTPLQMLELEHLAIAELGMTENMMTENAAAAIARTARQMAVMTHEQQIRQRRGRGSHEAEPLIVVLAGNHRTGSRAIAAARQLLNHSAQVVVCVLGLEQQRDLLECVRRQLTIFRNCGGRAVQQSQLMDTLKGTFASDDVSRHEQLLTTNLIIDALLGIHLSFEDLKSEHQHAYSRLVSWINTCDVTTISIDVPSGVDSSTGAIPKMSHIARLKAEASRTGIILQGEPALVVKAHHVLSLGAPKVGLVLGKTSVTGFHQNHHSWLVADIGLGDTVWSKSGLHGGHGVDFGSEWVTTLGFVPEPES